MNQDVSKRAQSLIVRLGLLPHPEGGYYRETYRGDALKGSDRATSTMIYFLLTSGDRSRFHRIDADESWHHYEGDVIRIHVLDDGEHRAIDLGRFEGEVQPQAIVSAGHWFGAEVLSGPHGYALVGCTVAPGFEFGQFELAERKALLRDHPEHKALIVSFT